MPEQKTSAFSPMHGETFDEWWHRANALTRMLDGENDPRGFEVMAIHGAIINHLTERYEVDLQTGNDGEILFPFTFVTASPTRSTVIAEVTIHHPERGPVLVQLSTAELAPLSGESANEWWRRLELAHDRSWDSENPALDELLAIMSVIGAHLRATYRVELGADGRFHTLPDDGANEAIGPDVESVLDALAAVDMHKIEAAVRQWASRDQAATNALLVRATAVWAIAGEYHPDPTEAR